jgi:hypothetical protein
MPIQTNEVSWHDEQPLVMPAWICAVVGAGDANSEPGVLRVVLAGSRPDGNDPRWQASQFVPDGMCEVGPTGDVGGIVMVVTPKNDAAVTVGP